MGARVVDGTGSVCAGRRVDRPLPWLRGDDVVDAAVVRSVFHFDVDVGGGAHVKIGGHLELASQGFGAGKWGVVIVVVGVGEANTGVLIAGGKGVAEPRGLVEDGKDLGALSRGAVSSAPAGAVSEDRTLVVVVLPSVGCRCGRRGGAILGV